MGYWLDYLFEFSKAHDFLAYVVLFFGSYFETLIGPGFFIHGEIFFLAGSIAAGLGYLNIWLVYIVSVLGGIAGDHSSYWLGKRYGNIVISRLFKRSNKYLNPANFKKGKNFFKKYGEKSLFYARLLGPVSWITPFLAGIFKTDYRKFTRYNALGVVVGIGQFMAMGYLIGFAYIKVFSLIILGASTLIMHQHYSIDVFAAFFITYGIYVIGNKIYNKLGWMPKDKSN